MAASSPHVNLGRGTPRSRSCHRLSWELWVPKSESRPQQDAVGRRVEAGKTELPTFASEGPRDVQAVGWVCTAAEA